VAAVLVATFHAQLQLYRLSGGAHAASPVGFAAAGTDMLFVISGCMMVYITHRGNIRFPEFILRRVLRVVPLYWLFTLLMLLAFLAMPSVFYSTKLDPAHVLASFALLPHQHPVLGTLRPLLVPGWAINEFVFFYLVFGLFLFLSVTARIAAVAAIFYVLMAARMLFPGASPLLDFYGAPIGLEFILGMLVGWVYVHHIQIGRAGICLVLVACASIFLLGVLHGAANGSERVVYWGLADAGLLLVCLSVEGMWGWPELPLLNNIGDASYSVYVSGLFSLALVSKLAQAIGLLPHIGLMGTRLVLVGCTVAIGYLVHLALERPLQRLSQLPAIWPRRTARDPRGGETSPLSTATVSETAG
jgi:peptidoglycan/LPS O-acetylase OafA/YrhL